jgi:concanavalin A-like lectin/glucanase superfamily protein
MWLVQWVPQTNGLFLCVNAGFGDCFGAQDGTLHDRWVHVVSMFSNGPTVQSALYIDGKNTEPICQTAAGFQVCNQQRTVAAPVILGGNSMYPFRGWLDEVRVYNRALSAGEVTALYNGTACP